MARAWTGPGLDRSELLKVDADLVAPRVCHFGPIPEQCIRCSGQGIHLLAFYWGQIQNNVFVAAARELHPLIGALSLFLQFQILNNVFVAAARTRKAIAV